MSKITDWADDLSMLEGTERLVHLIDLARLPTTLPEALRAKENLIGGCMSKIWVDVGIVEDKVKVYYDSDAMITKGITHVVCDCFSDIPVADSKQLNKASFDNLGVKELLTSQRRNGLGSLIDTIIHKVNKL